MNSSKNSQILHTKDQRRARSHVSTIRSILDTPTLYLDIPATGDGDYTSKLAIRRETPFSQEYHFVPVWQVAAPVSQSVTTTAVSRYPPSQWDWETREHHL